MMCWPLGGDQLLYIYANDGTDIGQKYLNANKGSAFGTTGFLAKDGIDVGDKLAKHKITKANARVKGSLTNTGYYNTFTIQIIQVDPLIPLSINARIYAYCEEGDNESIDSDEFYTSYINLSNIILPTSSSVQLNTKPFTLFYCSCNIEGTIIAGNNDIIIDLEEEALWPDFDITF